MSLNKEKINHTQLISALIFAVVLFFISYHFKNTEIPKYDLDHDEFLASISRIWTKPKNTENILSNYPFPLLDPPVTIAEAFEAYDGYLLDKPGQYHWAIDYVQTDKAGKFLAFPVYSAHEGVAFQGYGPTWGKYVVVRKRDENGKGFNTLYSHLENVPKHIPIANSDINNSNGIQIDSMTYIGDAGKTGNTKGINQLHFELHMVDENEYSTLRIDPYGVYSRLSSGLYPQPGSSLFGLQHYWKSNNPEFVIEDKVAK